MTNHLDVDAYPTDVFAVLLDPWSYGEWVVGTKRIRDVDAEWPAVGSRFHHRVGVGPAETDDSSKVLAIDPPHHLSLEVRFRPVGIGVVDLRVEPLGEGRSRITMSEHPVDGAVRRWWNPLLAAMTAVRNQWSLRRLSRIVGRRLTRGTAAADQAQGEGAADRPARPADRAPS